VLDPALLRLGRFDREIVVSKPDVVGREHILEVHVRKVALAPNVDLKLIARRTTGFSGADLMNLVNEAALLAVRRGKSAVGTRELDDARDRVTMGAERRSFVMTDGEKRLTAYREGGRAVVALHVPAADPVHKATIIPRGRSMGAVKQVAENDQQALTLEQMRARLAVGVAGRAAEELAFGRDKVTSAAAADLDQATKLARDMVTRWGLRNWVPSRTARTRTRCSSATRWRAPRTFLTRMRRRSPPRSASSSTLRLPRQRSS
jgi:cell division protease FtsH